MFDKVKLAACQMEPKLKAKKENLDKIRHNLSVAARSGARLIVFPECALTGYVFTSRAEALPYMESVPGPATDEVANCCRELGAYAVFGLLEIEGDKCFNAAALVGPEGLIGRYRKMHLPYLGIDRFLDHGDEPFRVYKTAVGNIGMHICYDCNFPESARIMTLMGADILALPTNWPEGRGKVPRYVVISRAFENKVHLVACDRVGVEQGTKFIGQSKVVNAQGDTLAEAGSDGEEIIYGEVSLDESRQKRIIFKAGEFELDFIGDRRPQFYGKITETTG